METSLVKETTDSILSDAYDAGCDAIKAMQEGEVYDELLDKAISKFLEYVKKSKGIPSIEKLAEMFRVEWKANPNPYTRRQVARIENSLKYHRLFETGDAIQKKMARTVLIKRGLLPKDRDTKGSWIARDNRG